MVCRVGESSEGAQRPAEEPRELRAVAVGVRAMAGGREATGGTCGWKSRRPGSVPGAFSATTLHFNKA